MALQNVEQDFRDHVVGSLATLTSEVRNMRERIDKALEAIEEKADAERVAALEERLHSQERKVDALKSVSDRQKGVIATIAVFVSVIGFIVEHLFGWWKK